MEVTRRRGGEWEHTERGEKKRKKKNIVGGVGAGDVKDDRMVDERRVT